MGSSGPGVGKWGLAEILYVYVCQGGSIGLDIFSLEQTNDGFS